MFETIIGLEVHVQLNTKTKLFCSCLTSFNDIPNSNICPTCSALPGALPVLNKQALQKSVMFANAINATVNRRSYFDRKSYFYPDSPLAYQITQFYKPIMQNGKLDIEFENKSKKTINIGFAHMEADAGKNIHEEDYSLVDLNRAGTPLLEIVTKPDLRNANEAILYLKKLHAIVKYLDISNANMQEGSFRVDVNVSIRPQGDKKLYTRVEIKNINSFKFIQKAIEYEVRRQCEAWEDGIYDEKIFQETRLFDQDKQKTRSMRSKEEAADYRYFPEPDLLCVVVDDEMFKECLEIPELPDEKYKRFINDYKMSNYNATVITANLEMANFFEEMMSEHINVKNAITWLTVELQGRLKSYNLTIESSPVDAKMLVSLIKKIENESISAKAAKEVLDYLFENKSDVNKAINILGLQQISNLSAIEKIIDEILTQNRDKVKEYQLGKDKLFGFFVGQVMKASKGSANPKAVNTILKKKLAP